MSEIQYLDYTGLQHYHELLQGQLADKADKTEIPETEHTITVKSGKKADGTTDITATSVSAENPVVTLGNSGVTAAGYGDTTAQTPAHGATFKVPYIKVNAQGIVTSASEHTVTLPTVSADINTATLKVGTGKTITTEETSTAKITFSDGTNKFSVSDGTTSFDVNVTPSITNNVTGDSAWSAADKIVVTNAASGNVVKATGVAVSDLALLDSPTFTGTPKAPTAAAGTDNTQIATTAFVKAAIDASFADQDAMRFKGVLGTGTGMTTSLPASHEEGDTYKVGTAGTYAGQTCEVGDMVICTKAGTSANNSDWTVVQSNIDGAVTGPASSVDNQVAVFNGSTGKVIKDSGFTIAKSVPSDAQFTDTTYSAGTGLTLNGTTFNHSNSVTAQSTQALYPITFDAQGHITGAGSAVAVGNKALVISSNSGTATNAITMNEASADKTLQIKGDGTWISGAVTGNAGAAVVTLSHGNAGTGSNMTTSYGTAANYTAGVEFEVLSGVTVAADTKGHVTGVSASKQKVIVPNITSITNTQIDALFA